MIGLLISDLAQCKLDNIALFIHCKLLVAAGLSKTTLSYNCRR